MDKAEGDRAACLLGNRAKYRQLDLGIVVEIGVALEHAGARVAQPLGQRQHLVQLGGHGRRQCA